MRINHPNPAVVSEIRIPTYPKSALHLSQPTDGSQRNTAGQQIASPIRNMKGWPLRRKGAPIPEGKPLVCGPAVWA